MAVEKDRDSNQTIEKEKDSNYLITYTRHLERRLRNLESTKSKLERELLSSQRDLTNLRQELDRLRQPPLISATVTDNLPDNRAIVKSSSGPSFVVNIARKVDSKKLKVNDRVALNQRTFSIMEALPSIVDPFVQVMEISEKPTEYSYEDIGGLEEQLQEVRETVELPLLRPELFEKVGINPPKGILLFGSPGTGKTLVAKAVANATNATFIRIIGSELVQKFIGEGARMVRELFEMARNKTPAIIFIDELDAIGSKRLQVATSGDREVQRTLMQLLSELDGFNNRGDVRIIGATNRPDILDPALLRPGRFDRLIEFPPPNEEARIKIFEIHTKSMNLDKKAKNFKNYISSTEGATGAEINAIVMEAGMFAIRRESDIISFADFQKAITKVIKGSKKSHARFELYA
ncbi:proteasome-activating nucleotidase [Promethearchaeum syntrophicum]|uniref:Proteasome-activating nucleotidase n=1 Tax=Promethearchaeum syntrophicum TaxID=2594042 RepID=A0A5B9D6P2_9ARCH|nr:Proteasome-activating nucleotidase [Candidatus Prometheoarchaeum syntrophicum]